MNEMNIKTASSDCDNLIKTSTLSFDELKEDVKFRKILLEKKEQELDKLIVKQCMFEYFFNLRDNFNNIMPDLIFKPLTIGPLLGLLFHFPTILVMDFNPSLSVNSVYSVVIPYVVGIAGTLVVLLKMLVNDKILFKKFNDEYLNNEMSYFGDYDNVEFYVQELSKVMKEIVEIRTKLENEKEILEINGLVEDQSKKENQVYSYSFDNGKNICEVDDYFFDSKKNNSNEVEKNYVRKRIKD